MSRIFLGRRALAPRGCSFSNFVGGEYDVTEVRIAQPEAFKGGTISIWTVDLTVPLNPVPGVKLGEVSASTTLFSGDGGVIQSWDFSPLNVLLTPAGLTHYLVFDSPMSWYRGFAAVKAWNLNNQWQKPFGDDPIGPAFEVRGNLIPSPSGLAMLAVAAAACTRRRR